MKDSLYNPLSPTRHARWDNAPRVEAFAQFLIKQGVNKLIAYGLAYVGTKIVTVYVIEAL